MVEKFIRWITGNDVMVVILGICFAISLIRYRARVLRESRPDYRPPRPPHHGSDS